MTDGFFSRDRRPYWFHKTKGTICIKTLRIVLVHQHGRHDALWKRSGYSLGNFDLLNHNRTISANLFEISGSKCQRLQYTSHKWLALFPIANWLASAVISQLLFSSELLNRTKWLPTVMTVSVRKFLVLSVIQLWVAQAKTFIHLSCRSNA